MKYLSVCSGIEAATQAWHPLGWQCAGVSEIEPFPRAVLQQRINATPADFETYRQGQSSLPLFGDFTQIEEHHVGPIDLLVGGTPCQDFSIAGLRDGLDGDRGNLTLEFSKLAYRTRPRWMVWENVPGAFSTNEGQDFGAILATFSGRHGSIFERPATGWKNAGVVEPANPDSYGLAWRVLDAQFTRTRAYPWAVPQRRRRIFIVGYIGDWRRAAAVLFDRESLLGNPAPRRQKGKRVAPTLSARPKGGGGLGTDFDCDGGLLAFNKQRIGEYSEEPCASTDSARAYKDATDLVAFAQNSRDEVRIQGDGQVSGALSAEPGMKQQTYLAEPYTITERGRSGLQNLEYRQDGTSNAILTPNGGRGGMGVGAIAQLYRVRRLTPRECERLQGFPDDYTKIEWRGKTKDQCPDGPRYKALGNSMAVNVMAWIGERIAMVERLSNK